MAFDSESVERAKASESHSPRNTWGQTRAIRVVGLSWLAMLGVDLFLHAGVLAPTYDWTSPFLLRPEQAFGRIPVGYLGLLILAIGLYWLLPRLDVHSGRTGALIAGGIGAVTWGALVLGLWSISTADPLLLAGWWVGQTVEVELGGFVIGSVLGGATMGWIARRVGALIAACAISAIALQAIGYAEAPVIHP